MQYTAPHSHPGRKNLNEEEVFVAKQLGTLDPTPRMNYEHSHATTDPDEAPPTDYWSKDGQYVRGVLSRKEMNEVS